MHLETTADPAQLLHAWLGSLRPGKPLVLDKLALVTLHTESAPPQLDYVTLAGAYATGNVIVSEKPIASVPTLLLVNRCSVPIFILDGEEIVGGRQNRVVNTTLLIPARCKFELDVTCVEQGRWHPATGETFAPGETLYPTLRQQKSAQTAASLRASGAAHADQAAVWAEVAARQARGGTRSSTHAIHDVYVEHREALQRTQGLLRYPAEQPAEVVADEPVGVVAVVSGRAICADIFDRSATLRAYWPSLVQSYALESEDAVGGSTSGNEKTLQASAMRLVSRAAGASKQAFASRGLGQDVRLTAPDLIGAALVHQQSVVHTALFRRAGNRAATAALSTPSTRLRRLRQVSDQ